MGKAQEALEFLKDDLDKAERQWTDGEQFQSFLQRNDMSLDKLLEKFDSKEDEALWAKEYGNKRDAFKRRLYRKRLAFLKASAKEFYEEYDPDVTDVDFMRLLEVPYTDPRHVIECSIDEMRDP